MQSIKMASSKLTKTTPLFVFLLALFLDTTTAQSSCTRALMGLSPCLNYVSGNSSTPSSSCCSQLSSVVQSQPQCLCTLLNSGASSYGTYNINQTLALGLPGICNVQTPSISMCNAANVPTASPESPPTDSSETPETKSSQPDIQSGAGSKVVPSTNDGRNVKATLNIVGFVIFVSSCAVFVSGF